MQEIDRDAVESLFADFARYKRGVYTDCDEDWAYNNLVRRAFAILPGVASIRDSGGSFTNLDSDEDCYQYCVFSERWWNLVGVTSSRLAEIGYPVVG